MAIDVRIPTILRPYTGGERSVGGNGSTVSAVIDDLEGRYAGIRERLVDEAGGVRRFVNIYVNDEDIRHLEREAEREHCRIDAEQPRIGEGHHAQHELEQGHVGITLPVKAEDRHREQSEREQLHEYIERGGFILIDDFDGWHMDNLREEMRRVFRELFGDDAT